jgi:hypothetical protein
MTKIERTLLHHIPHIPQPVKRHLIEFDHAMNRLWLREYEILLSSNRRETNKKAQPKFLDPPQTVKKRKKCKKKKEDKLDEVTLGNQILSLSMQGQYRRSASEDREKILASAKLSKSSRSPSPFRHLKTLDEFDHTEKNKEAFWKTGNILAFREAFPSISPHLPSMAPNNADDGRIFINGQTRRISPTRPKSSPLGKSPPTCDIINALITANDDIQIRDSDLEIAAAPIPAPVAAEAEALFQTRMQAIWHSGQCILYGDVTSLATMWQKSPAMWGVVKYLATLFGLKSSMADLPQVAERSVFRELLALVKYLREVSAIVRIKGKRSWWNEMMSPLSVLLCLSSYLI